MTRINIIDDTDDTDEGGPRLLGYFHPQAATAWDERTRWDGANLVSLATGSQWDHERLYRTAAGKWVLEWWSQYQGRRPRARYIELHEAADWLIRCDYPLAEVRAATGLEVPDEAGPR
jgi:hypothetical protein